MLKDKQIKAAYSKAAKGGFKDRSKLTDGQGLYLQGGKYWRYEYKFQGKRTVYSYGVYPVVSLAQAREQHAIVRKLLSLGKDPMAEKKAARAKALEEQQQEKQDAITFEVVAREWFDKRSVNLVARYRREKWKRIEKHLFPYIGDKPMADITIPDLISVLEHLHSKADLGKRISQIVGQICRYATTMQYSSIGDVGHYLLESLPDRPPVQHRARLTDIHEIGVMLNAIDSFSGYPITRYALQILAHVFLRSKELRLAKWADVDLEKSIWTIPAANMKRRREHIVPLSRQVREMLQQLHDWTGHGEYLFMSPHSRASVITDGTLLSALRRIGYTRTEMTIHGFRGIASTQLNELGFNSDLIEIQLAHTDKNVVRAAYNSAQWLEKRAEMMQAWSDYLDKLKLEASAVA